jgi:hypothetical protein
LKKWIISTLVISAVLGAAGFGGYRYYQIQQWNAAHGKALDALNRAYEYKDAGGALYESRWKDFEISDDDLQRLSQFSSEAQSEAEILRHCGDYLQMYRKEGSDASGSVTDAEDSSGALRQKFLDISQQYLESQRSLDKDIQHCLAAR